jgi:hypothetical protein
MRHPPLQQPKKYEYEKYDTWSFFE